MKSSRVLFWKCGCLAAMCIAHSLWAASHSNERAPGQINTDQQVTSVYNAGFGTDATLGLWAVWEVSANEYLLEAWLEPGTDPAQAIQLYNMEYGWDHSKLVAVGAPLPGNIFATHTNTHYDYFDSPGQRTFTGVLLGTDAGETPLVPVTLFTQLFHAIDPAGGMAQINLVSLTLRNTANQDISVTASDIVELTVDVIPPQSYNFDVSAQAPPGDQLVSSQQLINATLASGDGSVIDLILNETPPVIANTNLDWMPLPAPTDFTLSPMDGLKTVYAHLRDSYGNRSTLQDQITLDTTAPIYHVLNLTAYPRHEGVLLLWQNPIAPDFNHVRIYRNNWVDTGLPHYPEYDDIAPMDNYPDSETAAILAGFTLVYSGPAESVLDAVLPRDVYRYVAFAVDNALHVGPGHMDARDRSTNYILGDAWSPWDGTVFVLDLVALSNGYATSEGEPFYDPHLDFGPTDDMSREGIPLTDNEVGFEDLMIFAMNYGPFGPVLSSSEPDSKALTETTSTAQIQLDRVGTKISLTVQNSLTALGAHVLITWDPQKPQPGLHTSCQGAITRLRPGQLLFDCMATSESPLTDLLLELEFSQAIPTDLKLAEVELRDMNNQSLPLSTTDDTAVLPDQINLAPAFPNPFNPSTTLSFQLPYKSAIKLTVYNFLGQKVRLLEQATLEAGSYRRTFDASGLASGVYMVELKAGNQLQRQRMLLIR